ncbi:MAG: hypothetical protein ACQKBU_05545, partial [Verrucomicrobiales bacterium]
MSERSFCLVLSREARIVPRVRIWMLSLICVSWAAAVEPGEVVSEWVTSLPDPEAPAVAEGVTMAITASSKEVEDSVRQGLLYLHSGWDFEAYRHFSEAIEADPNCLMAFWGVGFSLLHGSEDLAEQREAALTRMLDLVDAGVGTDLEKRYVFGLSRLLSEGAAEAASAFAQAAEKYPNDPQLVLLKSLLGRGGFDLTGEATPDQERA